MARVHIGMYLEHESREFLLLGAYLAFLGLDGFGSRRDFHEAVKQLFHSKGIECRAEKHRGHFALQILALIKFGIDAINQLDVFTQFGGIVLPYSFIYALVINRINLHALTYALLVGCESSECSKIL